MKADSSVNSCAKWLSASPAIFELDTGASKDVRVTLQPINSPEAGKVKWAIMAVRMPEGKKYADSVSSQGEGFNIIRNFQFVIYVFQTPSTLTTSKAEVTAFKDITKPVDTIRTIAIEAKNTGQTILDCNSEIEVVNTVTGKEQKLNMIEFTLLPGLSRQTTFILPKLEKGKYKLKGLVDFGSKIENKSAEMELEIK
jgi:P pilus assembly chaperone PapD